MNKECEENADPRGQEAVGLHYLLGCQKAAL